MRPNKTNFGLSFGNFGGSYVNGEEEEEEEKKERKPSKVWIHDFEYGNHVLVWRLIVYGNYDDFVWKFYGV